MNKPFRQPEAAGRFHVLWDSLAKSVCPVGELSLLGLGQWILSRDLAKLDTHDGTQPHLRTPEHHAAVMVPHTDPPLKVAVLSDRITNHRLRASFANFWNKKGVLLPTILEFMRHSRVETTASQAHTRPQALSFRDFDRGLDGQWHPVAKRIHANDRAHMNTSSAKNLHQ